MDLFQRRTPGRRAPASVATESWFLQRGLPLVLTPRARWRRLWPRSAPVLAAYATTEGCELAIWVITGDRNVDIVGNPTAVEWGLLAIMAAMLPLAAAVGWLVSRLPGSQGVLASVAVAFATVTGIVETGPIHVLRIVVLVGVVLLLTAGGVGAVLGWAVRMTLSHLAAVGSMAVRALPVVLLTVLVFLNPYVWLMAATISQPRLWLALLFLVAIAAAFVISGSLERVRPMLRSTAALPHDCERLADTPFADMPDPPASPRLTRGERVNVVFVLATSQLMQILVVAVVIATIFFVLGLILLSEPLLAEWTHNKGSTHGTLVMMTVPVPQPLINTCLFLVALAFMYIGARAVGDGEYRSTFLDPLIGDLHASLVARNRYRGALAADAPVVDAGGGGD